MRTYGVICAASPEEACVQATNGTAVWGSVRPFRCAIAGAPRDGGRSWLELSVYDLTGILELTFGELDGDDASLAAMNEKSHIAHFIALQD